MLNFYKRLSIAERVGFIVALLIILSGIILRIIVWSQSRDFIIDEANVARNLYEKDFSQLAGRLDYEQYAPVLFMWIEKCFAMMYGYSEYALTAFPLLTGIATLVVFLMVLKEFVSFQSLWYTLALIAFAHFFLRYSTELKQYMGDGLISLLLILLALKTDIFSKKKAVFFFTWLVAGSIAVWSSMPSVFTLTGIGIYYLWVCVQRKQWTKIFIYAAPALLCLAQFGAYYMIVLKSDAHSKYLQDYHSDYFLVATPGSFKEWKHNWYVSSELVKLSIGYSTLSKIFNLVLLLLGSVVLLRKATAKSMLVFVPLFITAFAAAVNEFSLIPRVALFTMPLLLLLIAIGFDRLFKINIWAKVVTAGLGITCLILFNGINMAWKPFVNEQMTWALQFMKDNGLNKDQVYISHGSYPAYLYYTTIHPDNQRWELLKGASKEEWNANWYQISNFSKGKFGAIFTTTPEKEANRIRTELRGTSKEVAAIHNPKAKCYAYVLVKE